jgi:hypothetical protein
VPLLIKRTGSKSAIDQDVRDGRSEEVNYLRFSPIPETSAVYYRIPPLDGAQSWSLNPENSELTSPRTIKDGTDRLVSM